ncbi:hypothetical protein ElyMa_001897100 [Elysia marginata]|uniref:Uncharacterized protein n=1 Tax=Elysia marginata TaxID=1093978 RepID=A0AAV4ETN2_9GAST|nr:hypothetical protein ElyMa_001897100 [Elysia marginata]
MKWKKKKTKRKKKKKKKERKKENKETDGYYYYDDDDDDDDGDDGDDNEDDNYDDEAENEEGPYNSDTTTRTLQLGHYNSDIRFEKLMTLKITKQSQQHQPLLVHNAYTTKKPYNQPWLTESLTAKSNENKLNTNVNCKTGTDLKEIQLRRQAGRLKIESRKALVCQKGIKREQRNDDFHQPSRFSVFPLRQVTLRAPVVVVVAIVSFLCGDDGFFSSQSSDVLA